MYTLSNGTVPQQHFESYYLFEDLQVAVAFINTIEPPFPTVAPSVFVPLPIGDRRAFYSHAKLAGVAQVFEVTSGGVATVIPVDAFLQETDGT